MKKVAIILAAFTCSACTDTGNATRALEQAGYTHVQIGGYGFFACAEHDTFSTRFRAMGPTGVPVAGTVCSGWLKGQTIRLD